MEIRAAQEGLAAIPGRRRVHVHSDSAYVVNCFRDRWWERWERTGWIGANKQPVANRDLWERLLAETRRHDVAWHKVRGHSGDAPQRARGRPGPPGDQGTRGEQPPPAAVTPAESGRQKRAPPTWPPWLPAARATRPDPLRGAERLGSQATEPLALRPLESYGSWKASG